MSIINAIRCEAKTEYHNLSRKIDAFQKHPGTGRAQRDLCFAVARVAALVSSAVFAVFALAAIPAMVAGAPASPFLGLALCSGVSYLGYDLIRHIDPSNSWF